MSDNTVTSRRGFLKNVALGIAALPILGQVGFEREAYAQAVPQKPLDPNDPMAKTLGYVHDATTVDKAKFPKKAGPDGDKQRCSSCVLYLEGGKKIEGQQGEWGRCGLFSTGLVAATGWCNSWTAKIA